MKTAHEGVQVAALPGASWRTASAPNPFAPLLPPLDLTGAQAPTPPPSGRGGGRPSPVAASAPLTPAPPAPPPAGRVARTPAVDDAPVPPAPIPNAGSEPGQRTNSFLDKIFGAL